MAVRWKPIEDLPEDWSGLTNGELPPLLQYWKDQRDDLAQSGALRTFNTQLSREWAIETGQIEGMYDLDRGITRTLIEHGINADLIPHVVGQRAPELIAAMIRDHQDVLEGLFQFVKGDRALSKSYINELHAALLRHQDTVTVVDPLGRVFETELLKGRYKQRPNNPTRNDGVVHEYCPPEHVEAEMDRLIAIHAQQVERGVPVEICAAWLHHRFAQIHPFQDGNGRVARALASLVFVKAEWFPVLITRDDRVRYIDALEVADEGNLEPLITCFLDVQKRALFQAIKVAADLVEPEDFEEAVAALKKVVTGAAVVTETPLSRSVKSTGRLVILARERFERAAQILSREIGTEAVEYSFRVGLYETTDRDYDPGLVLHIDEQSTLIILVASAIGSKFRGLISMSVEFSRDGNANLASAEPFQVNYVESYENAERRFKPWLERSLVRALNLWRQSL